jgi:hypothetical protein
MRYRASQLADAAHTARSFLRCPDRATMQRESRDRLKEYHMTACISESVPTCLADWAILLLDNSMPPRDPNDDGEEENDEDDDAEPDEDEPAAIREPDE